MNRLFGRAAALLAACVMAGALPLTASAHGSGHHAETHHGWTTIDGKTYYYKNDGTCATKSTTINGVRYTFDKDGVCTGKYTGWVKSNGKKFYCCDGERQYGWVNVQWKEGTYKIIDYQYYTGDWYYIDPKKGRLTGKQTIDGLTYTFGSNGKWNREYTFTAPDGKVTDYVSVGSWVMENVDKKAYGGVYVRDSMCVILSVDGEAEKIIKKQFPKAHCVVYKKADYSMAELEKCFDYFNEKTYPDAKKVAGMWSGVYVDQMLNRFAVDPESIEKYSKKLQKYIDSLPCRDMIILTEDEGSNSVIGALLIEE